MRIDIHIVTAMMQDDAKDAIRRVSLNNEFHVDDGRFIVPAFTEQFQRILASTEDTSGIAWTPWVTYDRKEMDSVDIFEIWGRKFTPETARDTTVNLETLGALPFLRTGPNLQVRLLYPIHLNRVRGKPIDAVRVGDWAEEYLIGSAVRWAFAQYGLRGYKTLPVLRTKDINPWLMCGKYSLIRFFPPQYRINR